MANISKYDILYVFISSIIQHWKENVQVPMKLNKISLYKRWDIFLQ